MAVQGFTRALIGLGAIALMLAACTPQNTRPTAEPDKKPAEGKDTAAADPKPADSKPADPDACTTYANKFCAEAGNDSKNCASLRSLSAIMPPEACAAGIEKFEFTKGKLGEMGKACEEIVAKLCADIGPDTQTCAMVKEVTPRFPPEKCGEMLAQYPAVLAELKAEEEKNKPLAADKQQVIAAKDAASFGPDDAKVTLVEFSDFQCPYCTRAASVTTALKEKYKDKSVRVVFRHFPLSFHKDAHLASQGALAAHEQGKFWEFHDKLFANQKALSRADLEKYAQELKLDMGKFKKALDSGSFKKQVDDDMAMGTTVAVDGTPTMFLNGTRVSNPTSVEVVAKMIDDELAKQ